MVAHERGANVPSDKVMYLSQTDLFQGLDQRELHNIQDALAMTTCHRGRVFYEPGQTGEVLFILKRGRVTLYRITLEGRKLITATVEPGSVFGEMSLIAQGMYDSYAEASEDCLLCVMSRSDVEQLIGRYPSIGVRLLERLSRRLAEAEDRLSDVVTKPLSGLIAATLLRLSGEDLRPVRLTHQDIAEMTGTYRETATRILNDFRAAGLIDLRRMEIVVKDRDGLAAVARGDAEA